LRKASQQPGESEEIPRESSGRNPSGDGACRDSRLAGASGQRAAILSDIIINENLKIFLIDYLSLKVDVLFYFPSKSQYTWDRTYGRTVYFS
jgi:hypothetical protein